MDRFVLLDFRSLYECPLYDREVVVVVLLTDESAGILAERAYLVLERLRIADQLGFIQHLVDAAP